MKFLRDIIEIHGSQAKFIASLQAIAPEMRIQQGNVNNWLNRDKKIPSEWIIPICKSVHYRFTPHQLAPNLYPHPDDGMPAELRQVA